MSMETHTFNGAAPNTFPVTRTSPDSAQTPGAMERSLVRAASCEAAVMGELFPTDNTPKHHDRS